MYKHTHTHYTHIHTIQTHTPTHTHTHTLHPHTHTYSCTTHTHLHTNTCTHYTLTHTHIYAHTNIKACCTSPEVPLQVSTMSHSSTAALQAIPSILNYINNQNDFRKTAAQNKNECQTIK